MTGAQTAAWNVYISRLRAVVASQQAEFERDGRTGSISLWPPTAEHVTIIQAAIDDAAKEVKESVIHSVLGPVVSALDAIDNSKTKSQSVKDCRDRLKNVYDELHALKKRSASAAAAPAVPPGGPR